MLLLSLKKIQAMTKFTCQCNASTMLSKWWIWGLSNGQQHKQLRSRRPELMIVGCISGRWRKILPHWNIAIVWINSHLVHRWLICCHRGRQKPSCWDGQGFQLLLNPFFICFKNKFLFTEFVFLCLLQK